MADKLNASESGTMGDIIVRSLSRYPERTAFVIGERRLTYAEALGAVSQAVQQLEAMGLCFGDTVVQFARNSPEQWFVTAACYVLGLRSVTLQKAVVDAESQAFLIKDAEPRLFLCDSDFADRLDMFRALCPSVEFWYSHDEQLTTLPHFWSQARRRQPARVVNRAKAEDVVRLGYTSGTTGRPKGVMLSNRALVAVCLVNITDGDWPDAPKVLCAEPIAGGFGNMVLPTFMKGGTFVLLPKFDPSAFVEALERHRPSVILAMPPMIYQLLDHPPARAADWSCLRMLGYSGAVLPERRMNDALTLFGPVLNQIYGQTECPKSLGMMRIADHLTTDPKRLTSVGMPYCGIQVAVQRDDGSVCEPGELGEFCVRGPVVMSGYWKQPALTERVFRGGWLHTGDIGYSDDQGFLYLVDRMEDAIAADSVRVFPRLMETAIEGSPEVEAAAVIGIPDAAHGHILKAIVVPRSKGSVDLALLNEALSAAHPELPRLRAIEVVDALPYTAIGRLDRKMLRGKYLPRSDAA